jgi:hypothetical protein
MECPICGKECDQITVLEIYTTPAEDIADYLFKTLIDKGYAVSYDHLNLILDLIDQYMRENGAFLDDEESPE